MASWADIRAAWDPSWVKTQKAALRRWKTDIESAPERFRGVVTDFLRLLSAVQADLSAVKRLVQHPLATTSDQQRYISLLVQHNAVLAGIMTYAAPTSSTQGAPVLVITGLAISVVGVAWALAAREYAASLRDQAQLLREELSARVAASQRNTSLQPSTLPAPLSPPSVMSGSWWPWLLGLGVLGAGGVTFYILQQN